LKIFGQIEDVCFEQLSANPGTSVQGRVWDNTTTGRSMWDSGTGKFAFHKNDQKFIIGNDGTPANNVRVNKATAGVVQIVSGADTTAEGVSSTSLGQVGARFENLLNSALPAAGNAGRFSWLTDVKAVGLDDGVSWRRISPSYSADDNVSGTSVTLSAITSSVVRLTNAALVSITMIPAGYSAQTLTLLNRTGVAVSIINQAGATPANQIVTGTGSDYILPANSAVTLVYDATLSRWQSTASTASITPTTTSAISTKTGNYTITPADGTIICDATSGGFTITLPPASDVAQQKFVLKRSDAVLTNQVIINGTIDGQVDWILCTIGETLEIHSDGTAYNKINHITDTDWISLGSLINFYTMTINASDVTAGATYTNNAHTYTVAKTTNVAGQAYTFTLSPAASATAGATYTNNGHTYTVTSTIAGGLSLLTTSNGAPTASGVLTRTSGTGDAAINFSSATTPMIVSGPSTPANGTLTKSAGTGPATLTLSSFTGSAALITAQTLSPVFNPTLVTNNWKYRRSGRHIFIWNNVYQSAAGVISGTGDYLYPSPPGVSFDVATAPLWTGGTSQAVSGNVPSNTQNYFPGGHNGHISTGVNYMQVRLAAPYTLTSYRVWGEYNAGALSPAGAVFSPALAIGSFNFMVQLPVVYWKA
jgi:hypothetical protein